MKRSVILLFASGIFLLGCAHGRTANFPSEKFGPFMSNVIVMRKKQFWGWSNRARVELDGNLIALLFLGEYVKFVVEPGPHTIGTGGDSSSYSFEPNKNYFFLISPTFIGSVFKIKPIPAQEANNYLPTLKEEK